jgi:hypothetical protein
MKFITGSKKLITDWSGYEQKKKLPANTNKNPE